MWGTRHPACSAPIDGYTPGKITGQEEISWRWVPESLAGGDGEKWQVWSRLRSGIGAGMVHPPVTFTATRSLGALLQRPKTMSGPASGLTRSTNPRESLSLICSSDGGGHPPKPQRRKCNPMVDAMKLRRTWGTRILRVPRTHASHLSPAFYVGTRPRRGGRWGG